MSGFSSTRAIMLSASHIHVQASGHMSRAPLPGTLHHELEFQERCHPHFRDKSQLPLHPSVALRTANGPVLAGDVVVGHQRLELLVGKFVAVVRADACRLSEGV